MFRKRCRKTKARELEFLRKFEAQTLRVASGCRLWQGAKRSARGGEPYGRIQIDGELYTFHRVVWEMLRGSIPEGFDVLHKCDTRLCGELEHLFLGIQLDNVRDMIRRGREGFTKNVPYGERAGSAKLTEAKIRKIFELKRQGHFQNRIAERLGVQPMEISRILRGQRWGHLGLQI